MEPWTQPTTAPRQPDFTDNDESVVEAEPRVERGWMDTVASSQVSLVPHGDLVALEVFTAAVVITFVALSVVAGPVLLLLTVA